MTNINTMIDRASELLDFIYKSEESVGISDIAKTLNFPKATVFRILTTFEKWGIVEKEKHSGKYKLGMVLIKYGAKVSSNLSLVEISKPIIDDLSDKIGESMSLSIEHQKYSLNIYRSKSDNTILTSKLIPISPLNCSSSGKIFLSTKSNEFLNDFFDSDACEKRTNNSIINFDSFNDEKTTIQSTGISYDNEEYEYSLFCISSPIYYKENIIAAITVSGPKTRLELKGLQSLEAHLQSACKTISKLINYLDSDRLL